MSPGAFRNIGKYEVVSVLGRGAMGVVYRAVDPALGRHVAIKTMSLSDKMPNDAEFRQRFLREARAAGRLQHPNIVTVYELFEEHGTAYMVMELLEGAALSSLLRKKRSFDLGEKISILDQIASGLQAAHEHGIVHRDLKPSNVFVLRGGVVKVLDFGVAKVGEGELTQAGTVFGTVEYMAPEQVRGESVNAQADIFSLGVVAYELLVGRNPFRAETLGASVFKILSDNPDALGMHADDIPPAVERFVFRALAKKREERFRTMTELAEAIRFAAQNAALSPRLPKLSDEDVETGNSGELGSAISPQPHLDQWSNVAAAAGQLESIYRSGIEAHHQDDFARCAEAMSQVLDQVPAHSMALHYLAQSEERVRQQKLDPARHREAAALLAGMRQAHRQGQPAQVIELSNKALAIDPESLEARWYRRAAEARQRPSSSRTRIAAKNPLRSLAFESRAAETPGMTPTLVVAAASMGLSSSDRSSSSRMWMLGGVGVFFLALVGLIWGFGGVGSSSEAQPAETPSPPPSHVRVSPFDVNEPSELVLQVTQAGPKPSITRVVPDELALGAPVKIGVFGKHFVPGAKLEPSRPGRDIAAVSTEAVREELIEATIRAATLPSSGKLYVVVINPDGARSDEVALSVVPAP